MIIYLCLKFQSNTPILSKDIARKPKVIRTGRTDVRRDSGDTICSPPPTENGGGIMNQHTMFILRQQEHGIRIELSLVSISSSEQGR